MIQIDSNRIEDWGNSRVRVPVAVENGSFEGQSMSDSFEFSPSQPIRKTAKKHWPQEEMARLDLTL